MQFFVFPLITIFGWFGISWPTTREMSPFFLAIFDHTGPVPQAYGPIVEQFFQPNFINFLIIVLLGGIIGDIILVILGTIIGKMMKKKQTSSKKCDLGKLFFFRFFVIIGMLYPIFDGWFHGFQSWKKRLFVIIGGNIFVIALYILLAGMSNQWHIGGSGSEWNDLLVFILMIIGLIGGYGIILYWLSKNIYGKFLKK